MYIHEERDDSTVYTVKQISAKDQPKSFRFNDNNSFINTDDSVFVVRHKIANVLNVDPYDIYMYMIDEMTDKNKTNHYTHFLHRVYSSEHTRVSRSSLNTQFGMYFQTKKNVEFMSPSKRTTLSGVTYEEALEGFKEITDEITGVYVPIMFDMYTAKNKSPKVFPIDPVSFSQAYIEKLALSSVKTNTLSTHIGHFEVNNATIYVQVKTDFENIDDFYFDNHKDKSVNELSRKRIQSVIEKMDGFKKESNAYPYTKHIEQSSSHVVRFAFKTLSTNFLHAFDPIMLNKIFESIQTSENIPFIVYRQLQKKSLYKLLSKSIHSIVNEKEYTKWIEREKLAIDNTSSSIVIYVRLFESVFVTVTIYEDLTVKCMGGNMKHNLKWNDFKSIYDALNNYIFKEIHEITNKRISLLDERTVRFQNVVQYTQVITKAPLVVDLKQLEKKLHHNPFFSLKKTDTSNVHKILYTHVSGHDDNYEETEEMETQTKTKGVAVDLLIMNSHELRIITRDRSERYVHRIVKMLFLILSTDIDFKLSSTQNTTLTEIENTIESAKSQSRSASAKSKSPSVKSKSPSASVNSDSVNSVDSLIDSLGNDDDSDGDKEIDSVNVNSVNSIDSLNSVNTGTPTDVEDLLDDEIFDFFADQNSSEVVQTPVIQPTPSAQDKQSNETEDIISEELLQEFDKNSMNAKQMKRYHTVFVHDKLKQADEELFYSGYSKRCQSTDRKQPIVISEAEQKRLSKDTYQGYLKENNKVYICPLVWCPLSRISMTVDDLKKNNGKCPEPTAEIPIILDTNDSEKLMEMNSQEVKSKYKHPYYMNVNMHPNKRRMICCGKKQTADLLFDEQVQATDKPSSETLQVDNIKSKKKQDNEEIHRNFVLKLNSATPTPHGRYAVLPLGLHEFMNREQTIDQCAGVHTQKTCFLRYGIQKDNNQVAINAIISVLDNDNLKTLDDFKQIITKNLRLSHFMLLNNGNILKKYIPSTIDFNKQYEMYKRSSSNFTSDILSVFVKNKKKSSDLNLTAKRDLLLFTAFENFVAFLNDDSVEKHMHDILDIVKFQFINPRKFKVLILNTSEENNVRMLCEPYHEHVKRTNKTVVLLQQSNNAFESLVKYNSGSSFNSDDTLISELHDMNERNCVYLNRAYEPIAEKVYILLLKHALNLEQSISFVINYNIKLVGFLLSPAQIFIPIENEEFFFSGMFTLSEPVFIFKDSLGEICKGSTEKTQIYSQVISSLQNSKIDFYKDKTVADFALWCSEASTNENDDVKLFLKESEDDTRVDHIKSQDLLYDTIIELQKTFLKKLQNDTNRSSLKHRLELIRHPWNPFSYDNKISQTRDIIQKVMGNDKIGSEHLQIIAKQLYTKGLSLFTYDIYDHPFPNNKDTGNLFRIRDLLNGDMEKFYYRYKNPYISISSSSEDLTIPIFEKDIAYDVHVNKSTNNQTYKFNEVKPDSIYTSQVINRKMMISTLNFKKSKDIFMHVFDEIYNKNTMEFKKQYTQIDANMVVNQVKDLLSTNVNNDSLMKTIKYWMNLYNFNPEININNMQSMVTKDTYVWNIIELYVLCNHYNLGLIVIGKNKKSLSIPTDMVIRSQVELLLPPEGGNLDKTSYIIVFVDKNDSEKQPYQFVLTTNDAGNQYTHLTYSWETDLSDAMKQKVTDKNNDRSSEIQQLQKLFANSMKK